ncbi:hypothetical protein [Parabacteroides sp. PF5-6]|uniref:hypothetical protein n=1 Tax=Parabacteroides sp. PF5-6 TaxID=1742403 RepID=UPI002406E732|nr:hypothetical protein [Parabacteroides sp. PF5-6]MDF9829803.1 hypothetical protein [Parabacteroides sp. PF5-6]
MKAKEVNENLIGKYCHISGDLENGFFEGKPYICHESITRVITRITATHIICECGRKFLKNKNLEIIER